MIKYGFRLFFLFSLSSASIFSQDVSNDTITSSDIENYEDALLSSDFEQVDSLYKNIWNSTQIKYGVNLVSKSDTITIGLNGKDQYCHPCDGKVISKFGRRGRRQHTGTDIKLHHGDSVRCIFDGRVRIAKRFSGYGNMVVVRHNNGLETLYAHLSSIKVAINDTIRAGDLIGLGGRTGRATTEHLHFETRLFGEPFDSSIYIDFEKGELKSDSIFYNNHRFATNMADLRKKPQVKTSASTQALAAGESTIHVVRSGDSLWRIARKYGTSIAKICEDNKLRADQVLKIGSQIQILL